MLGRSLKLEIPRGVVVFYLLFALAAILWIATGAVFLAESVADERSEQELFSYLGNAAAAVTAAHRSDAKAELQPLVERFARERSLSYAAFSANDQIYVAHSRRGLIGKTHAVSIGSSTRRGDAQVVRVAGAEGFTREYSTPVELRGEVIGTLVLAVSELGHWNTVSMMAVNAPNYLFAPFLLIALGGFVIHRLVKPMGEVDSQLRRAAIAPTLDDADLSTVRASGAS